MTSDVALFVSSVRADIAVEAAALEELGSGRFSAVPGVYHEKPLLSDHELRPLARVLLPPLVGSSRIRPPLNETVAREIRRFQAGETLERTVSRSGWEVMA